MTSSAPSEASCSTDNVLDMDDMFGQLVGDIKYITQFEALGGSKRSGASAERSACAKETAMRANQVIAKCRGSRKRVQRPASPNTEDETLWKHARFTDEVALDPYGSFLQYVPRLVNVVTLAEAFPMPGSGAKLPLDLNLIASRCTGAYFAPKRFSAVQLAYTNPRARVLIFHTGRLVGTGTSGAMAARLAISRAQCQLAEQAGVHLFTKNFAVINQVGACSLGASLDCNAFANAHPHDSHYDQASFVGLAWRPANECICCEVYSTGRANLPGSTRERDLVDSWSRMVPELLRFSSRTDVADSMPEELKSVHFVQQAQPPQSLAAAAAGEAREEEEDDVFLSFPNNFGDDFGDDDLAALGL